ncbi:hypothetical protein KCP69_17580 [Salmonella enterica subsp. enterica]|nr:hypothetical protein KCP69_17580 [Salmonella enterica subsp. enterica]
MEWLPVAAGSTELGRWLINEREAGHTDNCVISFCWHHYYKPPVCGHLAWGTSGRRSVIYIRAVI